MLSPFFQNLRLHLTSHESLTRLIWNQKLKFEQSSLETTYIVKVFQIWTNKLNLVNLNLNDTLTQSWFQFDYPVYS